MREERKEMLLPSPRIVYAPPHLPPTSWRMAEEGQEGEWNTPSCQRRCPGCVGVARGVAAKAQGMVGAPEEGEKKHRPFGAQANKRSLPLFPPMSPPNPPIAQALLGGRGKV